MMKKNNKRFNSLLIESVDEAVERVIGDRASSLFWRHSAYLGIKRGELSNELPKLFTSLQAMFGKSETVGELAVRILYKKAGVPLNFSDSHHPVEYAEELKRILANENKHVRRK